MRPLSALISDEHLAKYASAHSDPGYGNKGKALKPAVVNLAKISGSRTILDYGAGKGALAGKLRDAGFQVSEYDPAVDGKNNPPSRVDMVVCNEVLEHAEPERLDAILAHMGGLMGICGLFRIVHKSTILLHGDGYSIIKPESPEWWHATISKHFQVKKAYADLEDGAVIATTYAVAPI